MMKFSIRTIYKNPKWTGRTSAALEHLQSFIDLRQRDIRRRPTSDAKFRTRIVLNVGGARFETFQSTLERYPQTLLGNPKRRALFYDKLTGEYFFDRHRSCFESILYYYQSAGRLRRPDQIPLDTFLEEITFFDLGAQALTQVRHDEELEEAKKVSLPTKRFFRHLWANLEYPQYSLTAKIINIVSMIFILLSAFELAIETLPNYRVIYDKKCEFVGDGMMINTNSTIFYRLCSPNFRSSFFVIQSICIGFFTVEFLLRLISCPSFFHFIRSFLNWIDFLAIVPFYLILLINLLGLYNQISPQAYYALGVLRLFRFVRVFKLYRIFQHIKSLRVLASTFKESIPDFIILFSFLSLSGFLFGAAIYFAENKLNGNVYDSIPKATYYGIITLTAVGYGDITPITAWGRALACFAAIYGISTVSMLVSVLVGRYQRVYNRKRFFNDDYSDEMIFNERCETTTSDDQNLEIPLNPETMSDQIESDDFHSDDKEIPSGKVRFIIGYMSDDDNDETDHDQDLNDNDEKELVQKIARSLLQSATC